MSSAAQRSEEADAGSFLPAESGAPDSLRQAVAERLAAHRDRRAAERAREETSEARAQARAEQARKELRREAATVREAVAARYQQSQSYREYLAAEAERAIEQARAEAEVAARNADAIAESQTKLLAELDRWDKPQIVAEPVTAKTETRTKTKRPTPEPSLLTIMEAPETGPAPSAELTVRLYEELGPARHSPMESRGPRYIEPAAEEELAELEHEIEFRRAPQFAEHTIETQPIPANIIEFPRQLVASRKARPRLAEGPLLEDAPQEPQLRIFEVEAEQIATGPDAAPQATGTPEWQNLLLDSTTVRQHVAPEEAQTQFTFVPQPAPTVQRLMAATVDMVCIGAGFILFATTIAMIAGPRLLEMKLPMLAGATVASLFAFYLLFQMLFFTLADATPGMRYARIGLCTFSDDNPTRRAMRFRTLATVLAACPLGIGLAWMWMDDDRLGWHDRISRMYQRGY